MGSPSDGSVATLKTVTEDAMRRTGRRGLSGSQIEQPVDKLILLADISTLK
jgi:hypothetical protein